MKLDLQSFIRHLQQLTHQNAFCIAFSGGVDSHVLLKLLAEYRKTQSEIQLRAVHINHGLSPNANLWQQHCQQICAALNIPLISHTIALKKNPGESLEALAREARYAFLAEILNSNEVLLTAHNADDQAETVLLQLLRGAGIKGLSAMPTQKLFANSELIRPLLAFSRDEIHSYATQNHLNWIEDESNLNLIFDRNYIRQEIMPLIKQRWPQALNTIGRSAENCAEAQQFITEMIEHDFLNQTTLNLQKLSELPTNQQPHALRHWIHQQGFKLPSKVQLEEIFATVIHSRQDATPKVEWSDQQILRFKHHLYIFKKNALNVKAWQSPWDLHDDLKLPFGCLKTTLKKGAGLKNQLRGQTFMVRFRQGGEKIKPSGRKETHALKKLYQEWQVPHWLRDRIPLLYYQDQLIAVVGYCVAEGYQALPDETGVVVEHQESEIIF